MIQDLVIKLDKNLNALGNEIEYPPMLYVNLISIIPDAKLNKLKAIPSQVEAHGYGVFEWVWEPVVEYNKTVEHIGVTRHADGIFRPTYIIKDATAQEIESRKNQLAETARIWRNRNLTNSDITQLPQATEQMKLKKDEWEIYRQELRDISKQPEFPFNIAWPQKPEEGVI